MRGDVGSPKRRRLVLGKCWSGPSDDPRDGDKREGTGNAPEIGYAFTILMAHFLKSVCFEMGSVASSVTLLIN
ncbi:MAG: hypothetical protein ACE1Y4_11580, partial [Lysobacterales bacterium]